MSCWRELNPCRSKTTKNHPCDSMGPQSQASYLDFLDEACFFMLFRGDAGFFMDFLDEACFFMVFRSDAGFFMLVLDEADFCMVFMTNACTDAVSFFMVFMANALENFSGTSADFFCDAGGIVLGTSAGSTHFSK